MSTLLNLLSFPQCFLEPNGNQDTFLYSYLSHKQTRHQFYLQLRRDLLDDRLSCHEETAMYLGALALQAEYGECMPEVSHIKKKHNIYTLKYRCLANLGEVDEQYKCTK